MPGFPLVPLHEVESLGVRGQPAVRGPRAEVEFGAVAMQRPARRSDPARIRVAAEQLRLLGVGPVAARDQQHHAGRACRALHAVERESDVWSHRLALPVRQRSVVPASLGEAVEHPGRQLGLRDHVDRYAPPLGVLPHLDDLAHTDADTHRCERLAVREADPRGVGAVRARDALRRRAREFQIRLARQVQRIRATIDHRRLEQPRVGRVHRPGARKSRKIRRALSARLPRHTARHRAQHEHADQQRGEAADEQHRSLPGDAGEPRAARGTAPRPGDRRATWSASWWGSVVRAGHGGEHPGRRCTEPHVAVPIRARKCHDFQARRCSAPRSASSRGPARPASASVRCRPRRGGGQAEAAMPRSARRARAARAIVVSGQAAMTARSWSATSASSSGGRAPARAVTSGPSTSAEARRSASAAAAGSGGRASQASRPRAAVGRSCVVRRAASLAVARVAACRAQLSPDSPARDDRRGRM